MLARYIQTNKMSEFKLRKGIYETEDGSIQREFGIAESVDYINLVFENYLKYGGIHSEGIIGKKILEIGPGDNLGVAIKFISKGAEKVVCLDRFYPKRDKEKEKKTYQALFNSLNKNECQFALPAVLSYENGIQFNKQKIDYISGIAIEDAKDIFPPESFDLIVSNAVLEHVYDIDRTFSNIHFWLKPGGLLIHKIDLKPHDLFPAHSNPLTFLTIPNSLWKLMTSHSGRPNRKRINYFRQKLNELGNYDFTLYVTSIFGNKDELLPHKEKIKYGVDYSATNVDIVKEVRKKLAKEFISLSDEELLIAGIFLRAHLLPI